MTISAPDMNAAQPVSARCTEDSLVVNLADGRTITAPLAWFPRLAEATPEARADITLSPFGLHWPELDEDVSVAGLLRGERGR